MSSHERRLKELSPKHLQVLDLISRDMKAEEIGRRLNLSVHTIRDYTSEIFKFLECHSQAGAVGMAMRRGLID